MSHIKAFSKGFQQKLTNKSMMMQVLSIFIEHKEDELFFVVYISKLSKTLLKSNFHQITL